MSGAAAKEYAAKLVEAYEKDIATGNAPGLTLRDLAETIIQEAIDETALAVGEAVCKTLLKGLPLAELLIERNKR